MFPLFATVAALAAAVPAFAATPDSWAKVNKASESACLKAAGLTGATAGPPIRFSDRAAIDARVVEGTWPQPHMKGAKARMLCLYNRKNKRVEVQEMTGPASTVTVKDVWWRAQDIGGNGIVAQSEVTLMLGSDGKIGGKSGCNGYAANYQLDGNGLKLFPPMIGTKMACPAAVMRQEDAYRALLEGARSHMVTPEGALVITAASGATIRFVKQ